MLTKTSVREAAYCSGKSECFEVRSEFESQLNCLRNVCDTTWGKLLYLSESHLLHWKKLH